MSFRTFLARGYQRAATILSNDRIELSHSRPNAVIVLAPDYGNIGDLAIGYAQERFIERNAAQYEIKSIPIRHTYRALKSLKRQLKPDDVVFLVGGGNMGDLYPRVQLGREFVAQYLRGQRMISFPQSIIYMDRPERPTSARREARALSKSAEWLTLFARERESLSVMKGFFPGTVGFAPDIVLSLISDYQVLPENLRGGVLLALRQDTERALTPTDHDTIRLVASRYGEVTDRDHGVPNDEVDQIDTYALALSTLDLYRQMSLVVTDRLHGMIFAAVTGTPCVVLPNTNHKISGTYTDWIAGQCPYVTLLTSAQEQELSSAIEAVLSPAATANYENVRFNYDELTREIRDSSSRATAGA